MQLWTAAWAGLALLTLAYFLLPRKAKPEPKPGTSCSYAYLHADALHAH